MELRATALSMSRIEPEGEGKAEADLAILIQRAIAGDASAFEEIVRRHERRVLTLAWRLLGNSHDAQDASQEVFLRAFRYLHRFDSRRRFEPWLIQMTVNVCRDLGRKRQPLGSVSVEPETLQTSGDPHSDFSSEEQRRILRAALDQLPERERAASLTETRPSETGAPELVQVKTSRPNKARRLQRASRPVQRQEEISTEEPRQVVMKLLTDDPNVVIYWLFDQKGGKL